ncbi:S9 family peptidase [Flavobacteriales bacterium]|nr:S9 family peptidase [Flavobacteriales bacterium]MDA8771503.1 S9 family peptidase [Flavobacteriales bacterium]
MASHNQPELTEAQFPAPPTAEKQTHITAIHGLQLEDDYFWMRLSDEQKEAAEPDEQTAKVVDYLNRENDYTKDVMNGTEAFQENLFNEIVGRIKQDDQSVPLLDNGYYYYSRYEEGKEYAIYCRKLGSLEAEEQVMLNVNEMAEGFNYYAVGGQSVSTNNNLLAFSVDTVSRREYTLQFKDLTTGEVLADRIPGTTGGATWANDNKTVYYSKKDPITLRSSRIFKHILGTDASADVLVFEEADETFSCGIGKSKSEQYLMIASYSTVSNEWRYLDANTPNGEWKIIQPRERNLEYSCSHYGDHFYITTNRDAKNFKLVRTPINATTYDNWEDVLPHRDATLLEGVDIFKDYLVVSERTEGLNQIRVKRWDDAEDYYIQFPDPAYSAYVGANPDFDTKQLRYGYNSMTTPSSVFEMDMVSQATNLLKQQEVLGGSFDPANYESERVMVEARDGTKVPVSIVSRKGVKKDGNNPFLLYAYGSYGYSMDAGFSSTRLSLLDRGFVYAIAHIRGGQEMGRDWYEDGKMFNKKNTFTDFVDCGQAMVDLGYTSPQHLYAMGGSAGGLLMGAVINMAPALFNGVIAAVPFVDVINTMLDESIPLTTGEFDEWGNPKNKDSFDYMMSYSPYDNVTAQDYPHMLVTTGYWDSQVQYWEPAKWVAKLRDTKTGENLLVMDCNMETGHGGASGRFKRLRETAMEYAFFMMLEGIEE